MLLAAMGRDEAAAQHRRQSQGNKARDEHRTADGGVAGSLRRAVEESGSRAFVRRRLQGGNYRIDSEYERQLECPATGRQGLALRTYVRID